MKTHLLLIYFLMTLMGNRIEAAEEDEAMKAFKRGAQLHDQERFAEAADQFRKAYTRRTSWRIQYNIGQCSAAAKQYGLALEAFEAYLAHGGDEVPMEKRQSVAEEIRILKEMVGYLSVKAPDGAEVFVDGYAWGVTPLSGPVVVAAGVDHVLEIKQLDTALLKRTLRVSSGSVVSVNALGEEKPVEAAQSPAEVTGTKVAPGVAPSGSNASRPGKPLRVAGWSTAGVGVGVIIGGVVTGALALSISKDFEDKTCVENECKDNTDRMNNLQVTTNVLLGVGGGLALTGVVMLIVSYVTEKNSKETISLSPVILPSQYSLAVACRF